MSLSQCPRCDEDVSLPDAIEQVLRSHPGAMMRCPRCGEDTPLKQIDRPPMIEIVDRDGQPITATSAVIEPESANLAVDNRVDNGPLATADHEPEFDFGEPSGEDVWADDSNAAMTIDVAMASDDDDEYQLRDPVGGDLASTGSSTTPRSIHELKTGPRRPRKKTSALKTLLGIAVGPPAALVIGYFILSAAGSVPDLGFWPFVASTTPARQTPAYVAPVQPSVATRSETSVRENSRPESRQPEPSRPERIELPMPTDESFGDEPVDELSNELSNEPEDIEVGGDSPTAMLTDGSRRPSMDVDRNDPDVDVVEIPTPPANPESLETLIDQTRQSILDLENTPARELQKPTVAAFRMLCDIAGQEPNRSPAIEKLLDTIKTSSHLNKFRAIAPLLMDSILRSGDGMFFIGRIDPQGDLMIAGGPTLPLAIEAAELKNRAEMKPDGDLAQNDGEAAGPVMVLGRMDSSENLTIFRASIIEPVEP